MQWKKCLFALTVIPLLSLAAFADTSDDALEAVLQKLKAGDATGAIADLDKPASLSPAQTIRSRYYWAFAHKKLGMADEALAEVVPSLLESLGSSASRMKHSVMSSQADGKSTILGRLPIYTAFFTYTHGNERGFADCAWNQDNGAYDHFRKATGDPGDDIFSAVALKNANQPYYNMVHAQTCETAGITIGDISPGMANAFGIASGDIDRAFLGWHHEMASSPGNPEWVKRLWEYLAQGEPVLFAVMLNQLGGWPQGEYTRGDRSRFGPVDAIVIGDQCMKLHGVYGLRRLAWSRPLGDSL